ncbi:hypothetical protein F5Y15DRAFT_258239 [Xylariaceae sp. FL0016]|nr:hypothetical protein F5Y15DRAFT_258239 [Xylariaceae sp. FL0016]
MSFTAVETSSHGAFRHTMVDMMARPLNSWAHESYAPRHAQYYPQEQHSQILRLPPPSSLVTGYHPHHALPNEREPTASSHSSYRDAYPSPAQRTPQPPLSSNESPAAALGLQNRRGTDISSRLSPTVSSTASDRSEDLSDHVKLRRFSADQPSLQIPRSSPQSGPPRELSHYSQYADIKPIRPPAGLPSRHTLLEHSPRAMPSPRQATWSPQADSRAPERMKISDLLSDDPGSKASSKAPERVSTLLAPASTYKIRVRQQPIAARSCGFGERDRRVIDPPPIVQVSVEDPEATEDEIKTRLHFSVMHCTIWNESGEQDCSAMPEDYRQQRRLMGTIVSSAFDGNDDQNKHGYFFCFPDLSCRTPGSFRLKFSLVILDPRSTPGSKTPVCGVIMSDVFTVYNAKDFPGMKASTPLTKRLKEQGCLISIKKGNEKIRQRDDSEEEDDDEDDDVGNRRGKRPRRS